jgi:hypothetical protein
MTLSPCRGVYWPNGRARGVQRVSYKHQAVIDAVIVNPFILQRELAAAYGYSRGWVGQILLSPVVQARMAARRAQLLGRQKKLQKTTHQSGR